MMRAQQLVPALMLASAITACGSGDGDVSQFGRDPDLPKLQAGLLPAMEIAEQVDWEGDMPKVPAGYAITALATGLKIPRQTLVLPNGDVLVAEGSGGGAPALRPKDIIAGVIKAQGKTKVKGGNRLTLLRDADGDGRAELKTVFLEGLNAPYGLAFINNTLFVANQDAVMWFPYVEGQTRITAPGVKLTDLPSDINHHWTKAMAASLDGSRLYVGIGSNSNITERGMAAEADRAMVWEIDAVTGMHRPFATGLRNPSALAVHPETGQLWAAVNERDELGANLVPDYLTAVREGGFYGWPYSYWGKNVDPRVRPQDPKKVASAIRPDYSLGSHVAPLGLAFSNASMGPKFASGAFVGEHGSWNRQNFSGYKVSFIAFSNGKPYGNPVNFVWGFLNDDGKARGRPVGVTVDPRGALLVADDLSNTVWRVAPTQPVSVPAPQATATPPPPS
jgi:glucose/arabinose dehydrogenase